MPESTSRELSAARADPRRRLGRFLLLSELGRGGMGVVYRAWDEDRAATVALKTILDDGGDDATAVERFCREGVALAGLRHPAIVPVHGAGVAQGRRWIAMALVDGTSLERLLDAEAGTPIERRRAVELLRDVARAVHHAHEHGVVHRDLKPANVMVDRDGRAFVMDFGLARLASSRDRLTKTGTVLGTLAYMSPEQASDASRADARSDVWSLGAMLWRILAGRPLHDGQSEISVLTALVTKDPPPPSSIDPTAAGPLEAVCLRCLVRERLLRYPSAAAFADDLDRWLEGKPVLAAASPGRSGARRRLALCVAAAGVAALGLASAVLFPPWRERRAREARELATAHEASRSLDAATESLAALAASLEAPRPEREAALAAASAAVANLGSRDDAAAGACRLRHVVLGGEVAWVAGDLAAARSARFRAREMRARSPALDDRELSLLDALAAAEDGPPGEALAALGWPPAGDDRGCSSRVHLARALSLAGLGKGAEARRELAAARARGPLDPLRAGLVEFLTREKPGPGVLALALALPSERATRRHLPLLASAVSEAVAERKFAEADRLLTLAQGLSPEPLDPAGLEWADGLLRQVEDAAGRANSSTMSQMLETYAELRPAADLGLRVRRDQPLKQFRSLALAVSYLLLRTDPPRLLDGLAACLAALRTNAPPSELPDVMEVLRKTVFDALETARPNAPGKPPRGLDDLCDAALPLLARAREHLPAGADPTELELAAVSLLAARGDPEGALARGERLLREWPGARARLARAKLLADLERRPEALAALDEALGGKLEPGDLRDAIAARTVIALGWNDVSRVRLEDATDALAARIGEWPETDHAPRETLVQAEERLGRTGEALAHCATFWPGGERAAAHLLGSWVRLLVDAGQEDESLAVFAVFVRRFPDDARIEPWRVAWTGAADRAGRLAVVQGWRKTAGSPLSIRE